MPLKQPIRYIPPLGACVGLTIVAALTAFAGLVALLSLTLAPATAAPIPSDTLETASLRRSNLPLGASGLMRNAGPVGNVANARTGHLSGVLAPTAPPTDTTTTITSDSPDPSVVGQSVTVSFQVTPDAASSDNIVGTVTVSDGTGATCSAGVSGSTTSASGSCALTPTTAGLKTLTATFTPSNTSLFNGSSDTESHQVDRADTTTTVTFLPSAPKACDTVTFTATVAAVSPGGGTPSSGTVTFFDGTTVLGTGTLNASGQATFSTASLSVGLHSITAVYAGNSNYNGSTSAAVTVTVKKASSTTTVTTLAPNPSTFGDPVTIRATVTGGCGTPTGLVFFNDGGITIGTAVLDDSGVADLVVYDFIAGVHELSAVYHGDDVYQESMSSIHNHTVNRRSVSGMTLVSSANPSVFGQQVTFTTTVGSGITVTPTGQVIFRDNGTVIGTGTLDGSGRAIVTTANLEVSPPSHSITASYLGDQNFLPGDASLTQTVNKADTTAGIKDVTVNPSVFGQSVTFTAVVSPTLPGQGEPTGKVFFQVDSKRVFTGTLGFTKPGEVRWITTPGDNTELDTVGSPHQIKVFYEGDGHFNPSDNTATPFSQTVNKANTTVRVTKPLPRTVVGQEVAINAVVQVNQPGAGTPTGYVSFTINTPTPSTHTLLLPSGSMAVTFRTRELPIGTTTIDVRYLGDDHFNASPIKQITHDVDKADSETTLETSVNPSVFGQTVTFTATVKPAGLGLFAPITPTGTVTFTFGAVAVVTRTLGPSTGVATVVTDTLPVGSHTVTAEYAGDTSFNPSDNSLTQTVTRLSTTTLLSSSAAPGNTSTIGQPVTFTVTVTTTVGIVPTGTVTLRDGGGVLATVTLDASGVAAHTASSLSAGSHAIMAIYNGTPNFDSSSSDRIFHTVNAAGSTTTLTSSAPGNTSVFGQTVFFTATVSAAGGTPTGQVIFKDGTATIGTATLNGSGVASISTAALTVGPHPITAVYGGDANFAGSTSNQIDHTVNQAGTTTTITTDVPDPSVVGQPVSVSFIVVANPPGSGTPTGNVTVSDGFGATCTATVAVGTCTLSPATTNVTQLTATYAGDTNFAGSSDTEPHQVDQADTTTTVTSFPNPSLPGQTVTITATVTADAPGSGIPTGTVTFKDGTTPISGCSPVTLSSGVASCTTAFTTVGTVNLSAEYGGDSNFKDSTGTATHEVSATPADLSVTKTDSPDPVLAGDVLTYTIVVVNPGPATDVTLTDTLPPQVTFQSLTQTGWSCTTPAVGSTGTAQCTKSSVTGTETLTLVVNVTLTTPAGTILRNTAQVSGSRPDPDLSNNTSTQETTVFRSPRRGDCNGDNAVNLGDIVSIVRDIFDPGFRGSAGCDANQDARVDAGDVPCTVLIMAEGPGVCGVGGALSEVPDLRTIFGLTSVPPGPVLSMPELISPQGSRLTVPLLFAANGHRITSLAFSVDYDESWLSFDTTDGDANGVPDGMIFSLPAAFEVSVAFEAGDTDGELDVFIADISPPLTSLSDGVIGLIVLNVDHPRPVAERAVRFSLSPAASFGNTLGLSVAGSATPTLPRRYEVYLSLLIR